MIEKTETGNWKLDVTACELNEPNKPATNHVERTKP